MPKFVLIDQSIREFGGHHFEYAVHVLRSAQKAGYKVILGVNREFRRSESERDGWETHAVYEYDFWGVSGKVRQGYHGLRRLKKAVRNIFIRLKARAGYSWLGLFWTMRHNPRGLFDLQGTQQGHSLWWALLLAPAAYALILLRSLKRFLGALTWPLRTGYPRTVAAAFWDFLVALAYPVRLFMRHRDELLRLSLKRRRISGFGRDTETLLEKVALRSGDHVFIPTLSELDMLGLMRYLKQDPRTREVTWHLLFRRNIYTGRNPEYSAQDGQLHDLRQAFDLFREGVPDHHVYFYTDTEPLTEQYNRLNTVRFETLPIPVNEAFQNPQSETGDRALRVTYVGDARSEKGYQYLPAIVRSVWRDYVATGKLRFIFQSNFAFQTPEGQADVVMARTLMEQMDPQRLTVFKKPLDTDAYRDLILSSDIGLLLYDRNNYYARSSGVLVESLSAGIPVVVPSGSWLADQFAQSVYRHQYGLRDRLPVVESLAAGDLDWSVTGSAATNPLIRSELSLPGGGASAWSWVDVPEGASYLLVSLRHTRLTREAYAGTYVTVHVTEFDENEYELSSAGKVTGQEPPDGKATVLFALKPGTRRFWLGLKNAYGEHPVGITDLQIDFLAANGASVPFGAVGLIATTPDEVPSLLADIADHYDHYRQTAGEFARRYIAYHNPDQLVAEIVSRGVVPPSVRKGGERQ